MDKRIQEKMEVLEQTSKLQLVLSQEQCQKDEISLSELFKMIIEGKRLILLIVITCLVMSSIVSGITHFVLPEEIGQVQTIIGFDFDGIEEGLNPNKETFNVGEMINKQILDGVIRDLSLDEKGIDSDLLKENISFNGIIPQEVQTQMNLIQKMAEKDPTQLQRLQNIEIYPTQYKVTLKITKEMHLDRQEAEEVLTTMINHYKTYFMDTYNDKITMSIAAATTDVSRYDYSEYILFIDNELKGIQEYLQDKQSENEDYRAKSTGMSFGDLETQVSMLRDIEINNTQALINTYTLTKNKERLISIYQNNIRELTSKVAEQQQMIQSLKKAANDYQKDQLVVMGKEVGEANVEVSQGSETYDQLIEQVLEAEQEANQLAYNKSYYEELLAHLTGTNEDQVAIDTAPYEKQVETSIGYIQEQVGIIIDMINRTVDEYYTSEVFKNSVKMDMPSIYESYTMTYAKKAMMIVGIGTVLGLVLGVMIALFKGLMSPEARLEGGMTYEG